MAIPEALFRTLVQFAPDAFIVTDRGGVIIFANAQAEHLFGYAREELVGSRIERLVPERYREEHEHDRVQYASAPQARPMGIGLQLTARRRDGSEVPVEISLSPIYSDEDRYVAATVRDVSERRTMESALRGSEERYRLLAHNADDVVYRLSLQDWPPTFDYLSPSVARLTGHSPEAFVENPNLLLEITHPDDRPLLEAWLRSPASHREDLILRAVKPDGAVVWHEQRFTPIADESGRVVAIEGIARDITERRELEDERRLLLAESEIERERERIAADLHDGVMQTMYSVGLQISSILRRVPDLPEETRGGLNEAVGSLNDAMTDIRRYVMDLRPADFTGDLVESLSSLARLFESTSGIPVTFTVDADVPVLDETAAVELFLLVREALSNVRRHAHATAVTMSLTDGDDQLKLRLTDNGEGFDLSAKRRDSQFGLRNMETRARLMGGAFDLQSTPGAGTTVCVTLPVARRDGDD
ncbi:MAG: PAS domain S-box protein [Dehalococcoidia bacterium]